VDPNRLRGPKCVVFPTRTRERGPGIGKTRPREGLHGIRIPSHLPLLIRGFGEMTTGSLFAGMTFLRRFWNCRVCFPVESSVLSGWVGSGSGR
jgi:hypothetical protein